MLGSGFQVRVCDQARGVSLSEHPSEESGIPKELNFLSTQVRAEAFATLRRGTVRLRSNVRPVIAFKPSSHNGSHAFTPDAHTTIWVQAAENGKLLMLSPLRQVKAPSVDVKEDTDSDEEISEKEKLFMADSPEYAAEAAQGTGTIQLPFSPETTSYTIAIWKLPVGDFWKYLPVKVPEVTFHFDVLIEELREVTAPRKQRSKACLLEVIRRHREKKEADRQHRSKDAGERRRRDRSDKQGQGALSTEKHAPSKHAAPREVAGAGSDESDASGHRLPLDAKGPGRHTVHHPRALRHQYPVASARRRARREIGLRPTGRHGHTRLELFDIEELPETSLTPAAEKPSPLDAIQQGAEGGAKDRALAVPPPAKQAILRRYGVVVDQQLLASLHLRNRNDSKGSAFRIGDRQVALGLHNTNKQLRRVRAQLFHVATQRLIPL
ncbi:unnamed protein product [Parajaminaea phylloscopi]